MIFSISIWSSFLDWLKEHLLTCPSKYFFHIDCPGCGMQRSILALLEGDIVKSLSIYPATIPIFVLFGYTFLHLKFDFSKGAFIIKWGYIACTIIILAFYIYKILNNKLI